MPRSGEAVHASWDHVGREVVDELVALAYEDAMGG